MDKAVLPNNPFFDNIAVDLKAVKKFVEKLQIYDFNSKSSIDDFQADFSDSWHGLQEIASRHTNHPEYVVTSQWIG